MARSRTKAKEKVEEAVKSEQYYREMAFEANKVIDSKYLELSEALFEIKKNEDWYRNWGHNSFQDYCEKELGVPFPKASALTTFYDQIKGMNISKERLAALGFAKARVLARYAEEGTVDELLDEAEKTPAAKFQERTIKRFGSKATRTVISSLTLKFAAGSPQASTMAEGLERAKQAFGTDDPIQACASLVADWMARTGTMVEAVPAEDMLKLLNKSYTGTFSYSEEEDEPDEEEDVEDEEADEDEDAEEEVEDEEETEDEEDEYDEDEEDEEGDEEEDEEDVEEDEAEDDETEEDEYEDVEEDEEDEEEAPPPPTQKKPRGRR